MYKYYPLIFLLWAFNLSAQTVSFIPNTPPIKAESYLLVDINSKKVLAEKEAKKKIEPASITKIMTAHVVFRELEKGSINLSDQVLISQKAWRTEGSRMFIEVNKRVSVEDLLKGLIIQSGNDAAVALAEHIAGSEEAFVELMNNVADDLGMSDTNYVNTTGLPNKDHYTTAEDIVKIASATIQNFPDFYKLYSQKEFTFNEIRQFNRNSLLWRDETVDGVKTGHTSSAGYCLISSAERNGMRLISVIMGAKSKKSRVKDSSILLNFGFRFYQTFKLYKAEEKLNMAKVWKGEKEDLALGLAKNLYVTIPRNQYDNLDAKIELNDNVVAPIKKGEKIGEVFITFSGKSLTKKPLIALENIKEGSIWVIFLDSILLWFAD